MKKIAILLALTLVILSLASCGTEPADERRDNMDPDSIGVNAVYGLNGQIYITLSRAADAGLSVYWRTAGEEEYSVLDRELILSDGRNTECYIPGLSEGLYDVMIEEGTGGSVSRVTFPSVDVAGRDTSGYAHFKRDGGIGGYNADGTVREGAKILYVSNANKNTVSLESGGRTYTGLYEILSGCGGIEEPLIIRVLDRITTNQWIPSEDGSTPQDPYTADDADYGLENMFSDAYGDNIAGIPVSVCYPGSDKTYDFITSAKGLVYSGTSAGRENYGCIMNVISSAGAHGITIEGIGGNAAFFQFGLEFVDSDSVEIRNLTFEGYPQDALKFTSSDISSSHGGYWVHGNTFLAGYSSWGTGSKNGDDSVEFSNNAGITVSYNRFEGTGKALSFGDGENDACMNVTVHHNIFSQVVQKAPFCRNTNIHSYNNYYKNCTRGATLLGNAYMFCESNFYLNVDVPFTYSSAGGEPAVKSYAEFYSGGGNPRKVFFAEERGDKTECVCMPDGNTDFSSFDTDPALFYYDAENGRSDVRVFTDAADVPAFLDTCCGSGATVRLDLK